MRNWPGATTFVALVLAGVLAASPAAATPTASIATLAAVSSSGDTISTPDDSPEPDATAPATEPTPSPDATVAPEPTAPADNTPDAESGTEPDAESGTEPDAESETEPGAEAGTGSVDAEMQAAAAALPPAGRIGGADLYARSILASRAAFPSGSTTALVANGGGIAGPTIAASAAGSLQAPLIYARPNSLSSAAAAELRRLGVDRIVVVGTDDDVDGSLLSALRQIAPVDRLLVTSRTQGSRDALRLTASAPTAYLTGDDLAEHAAAVAAAAAEGGVALMVGGDAPAAGTGTIDALERLGVSRVVVVGGTSRVSSGYAASLADRGLDVVRVTGADRYALSLALAKRAPGPVSRVYAANPDVMADRALAAALGGVTRQPLVYTTYQCMLTVNSDHIGRIRASVVGVGKSNWLRDAAVRNVPCAEEKPRLNAALDDAIRATAARYEGTYSVTVREFGRLEQWAHVRGGVVQEPASMMKLYAAYAALRRVQLGVATMSTKPGGTTLSTCLRVMIHASDNYCHSDIVHWIGISRLNGIIDRAGFHDTHYGSVPRGTSVLYAGNRTTTDDLTAFMRKLERGQLLNEKYTNILLGYMRSQIWTSRIASGIPPGIRQETKPGSLWISSGLLQADTGIVRGPQTSWTISIIGTNNPSKAALRAITRTVYTHFHGSFGSAASYPVKQMVTRTTAPIRSSPGGGIVTRAAAGTYIEVTDAQRVWYKVRWGSGELWVDSRLLRNR